MPDIARKTQIEGEWNSRRPDGMFWEVEFWDDDALVRVYAKTKAQAQGRAAIIKRAFAREYKRKGARA